MTSLYQKALTYSLLAVGALMGSCNLELSDGKLLAVSDLIEDNNKNSKMYLVHETEDKADTLLVEFTDNLEETNAKLYWAKGVDSKGDEMHLLMLDFYKFDDKRAKVSIGQTKNWGFNDTVLELGMSTPDREAFVPFFGRLPDLGRRVNVSAVNNSNVEYTPLF